MPHAQDRKLRFCIIAVASALYSFGAQGQSLAELFQSASRHDASFKSAQSQYEANLARAAQSKAGLLPTIGLTASANQTDTAVTKPITNANRRFGAQNAALNLSQPLYRPANHATAAQGQAQADQAQFALVSAEQDLMVRLAQAYFEVLISQESLVFVKAQKAAVSEQLAAAKRNFEVGTSTITDQREAQARFDLVTAQEIAAENDLRVKQTLLDQLTGQSDVRPKALADPVKLPSLIPNDVNAWVQQAQAKHPSIKAQEFAVEIANLEIRKAQSGHQPTVDLTASHSLNWASGSASNKLHSESRNTTAAVVLNLPLFAGFATQNRVKETLHLLDKARNDLEAAKRNAAQATRTAFFGVVSGLGQVKALEAAESSSQSALDANRLGYQVGVRINIDVLNSQSQLFQTKRDLAKARYELLLAHVRLRQASGMLFAQDLEGFSALLNR